MLKSSAEIRHILFFFVCYQQCRLKIGGNMFSRETTSFVCTVFFRFFKKMFSSIHNRRVKTQLHRSKNAPSESFSSLFDACNVLVKA